MKKSLSKFFLLVSLALAIVFVIDSCKKRETDTDSQASVDNSICEGEFSRIFPQANGIAVGDSGVQKGMFLPIPESACPDYYIDSLDVADGFPVTMWLYYGHDNDGDSIYEIVCTGTDGRDRQGIVRAVFDGPWNVPGSRVTMQLKNYFVNNIHYEGTVSVTRSLNTFTQTVTNGKCTKGSDWTILWNSQRTITTLMADSLNPNDDVCLITGTASGTDRGGKTFEMVITTPLRREMGCPWIVFGEHSITPEGKKTRTVNFGDGTCDDRATLIIDGNEFEFRLLQ